MNQLAHAPIEWDDPIPETETELLYHLLDRTWRLNNLYTIKNKDGEAIKFQLNSEQWKFYENMHNRNIILKARQLGFTTFMQIYMLDACMFDENTNAGVVAHNKDDAQAFFKDKIKFAYDNLDPWIKAMHPAKNESAGELRFANGSVIRVGTSLRSGTLQILHVSEYGKLCAKYPDRALEVRTGTLPTVPTNGIIVIESTAEGRNGDFFVKAQEARKLAEEHVELTALDYKFHFFPWHDTAEYSLPAKVTIDPADTEYFNTLSELQVDLSDHQKAWYIKKRAETNSDDASSMKREYPSYPQEAFEASVEGAYFSKQMAHIRGKGQICNVPIERQIPIMTFWDLGRDTTAIWFFQKIGLELRMVDYFQKDGEDIDYFIHMLSQRKDGQYPYLYDDLYLPHDGDRKSLATKQSVAKILHNNGYTVRIVRRTPEKTHSIENARRAIPNIWFDRTRCVDGITALDGYRKEWDDKLSDWKPRPVHDRCSHGADAFMTFADGWYIPITGAQLHAANSNEAGQGRNQTTGY